MGEEIKPEVSNQSMGFLQIATGLGVTTVATYLTLSYARSLTEKEKILFSVSGCCVGASFLAAWGANVLASFGKTGRVARCLSLTAGAAIGCGFSFWCGLILPPYLKIWLPSAFSAFITVVLAIAIAYLFLKI